MGIIMVMEVIAHMDTHGIILITPMETGTINSAKMLRIIQVEEMQLLLTKQEATARQFEMQLF